MPLASDDPDGRSTRQRIRAAQSSDAVVIDAAPGGGVTLETVPAGEPLPETVAAGDGPVDADVPMAPAGEA